MRVILGLFLSVSLSWGATVVADDYLSPFETCWDNFFEDKGVPLRVLETVTFTNSDKNTELSKDYLEMLLRRQFIVQECMNYKQASFELCYEKINHGDYDLVLEGSIQAINQISFAPNAKEVNVLFEKVKGCYNEEARRQIQITRQKFSKPLGIRGGGG